MPRGPAKPNFGNQSPQVRWARASLRELGSSDQNGDVRAQRKAAEDILMAEEIRRTQILIEFYEIEDLCKLSMWPLAVLMARDFVRGFDVWRLERGRPRPNRTGRGRPPKETNRLGTAGLVFDVKRVMTEKEVKVLEACKMLCQQKDSLYFKKNPKTLETRYHELKPLYDAGDARDCVPIVRSPLRTRTLRRRRQGAEDRLVTACR